MRRAVLATAVATVCGAYASAATTYTYTGSATGDVNVAANWSPSGVPTAGDTALFDGTVAGALTLTNSGSVTTASPGLTLSITSPTALTIDSSAQLWRLGNTAVTVASGAGPFSMGNGAGTTVNLTLGGSSGTTQTFTNNSTSAATIGSDVLFVGGGSGTHTVAVTGSGSWAFNGAIDNSGSDKTQTGALFNVTKAGAGTLTLGSNANLYSGNTIISGGTLRVAANNALGFAGQYNLNRAAGITTVDGSTASATLDLGGGATVVNEPIVLSGGANGANLINSTAGSTVTVDSGVALIRLTGAGTGYTASSGFNSLTTTISGGGGSGATATAYKGSSAGDTVTVVFMGNAGSGYTSAPTVAITGANGNGSNATAQAVLSSVTLTGTNNNIGGDGNLVIAAAIGESAAGAGFTKVGAGTTTLSGVNTFTGTTTVTAGTLAVNSNAAAIVLSGGSLAGTGTVGAVSVSGTGRLTPGNGLGTLTTGNITFGSGGTAAVDVGAGTASDLLAVAGTLDLTAAGDTLDLEGAAALFDGSTKTLATYAALLGTFDAVTLNGAALDGTASAFTVNGQTYSLNYGTGMNSAITLTAVPEPTLLGIGLVAAGLATRRRRA